MFSKFSKFLCWYQIWSLIILSSSISGGNCPQKCYNCKYDSSGSVTAATCKDVQIPMLPKTLQELQVSDATGMNAIMFRQFRSFVLNGMSSLTTLSIQNYKISTLNGQCFQGAPGLQMLDLSKNAIGQISEINFEGLQSLSYLSLNQNKLTKIGDSVFQHLTDLVDLKIALNHLDVIEQNDFKGLVSIRSIDLQSNNIHTIHTLAFQGLKTLETINLQSNELTRIHSSLFGNLPNLKTLSLQRNKISYIAQNSVPNSPVTYINLMNNEFTKVPTEFLQNVSNTLLEVNLARNKISRIEAGELQRIVLKTLFLVANSIVFIHPDALCYSFIEKLDLEQNLLKKLPEGLQNSLNQSNTVLLDNNPWSCDCDIQWMELLLKTNIAEPVCAQPLSYHGQKLSQILDDLEISCGDLATLPVPSMHFPVPPRLNPVTPHLERKTTTCQTSSTVTRKQQTDSLETTGEKGNNSITAIVAGTVSGVIVLAVFIVFIVIYLKMSTVKIAPEFNTDCKKPDKNFKPVLKYAPQSNNYII